MTLEQEATQAIHSLPAESLRSLVDYANFLLTKTDTSGERRRPYRSIIGRSKGKVRLADDFNEIPDGFKEYV